MTAKLEAQRPPAAAPLTGLPAWRQLRWSMLVAFVLLAVLPITIFAGIALPRMRTQVRQPVVNQLESVAELKTQEAVRWLTTEEAALELLYAGRNQRDRFILLATADMPSDVQVNTINSAFVDAVNTHAGFREFFLYDVQGHVLASSNAAQIGQDVTQQPYFATSLTGRYVQPPYYEANTNELTMIVTRPVQDNSNRLVGVLAGRLDLETLARIMTERTGLGTSGETYLVSVQGNYLLTPSRFTGYEMNRAYHSLGIDRALAGQGGSTTYTNYRGVTTLGVYRWVPELQAGLLAEYDQAEALRGVNQEQNFSLILGILTALVALVIGLYAATSFSTPITALSQVAVRIAGGDLTARARTRQRNELGMLAHAFNHMADQVQDLVGSLEARVQARMRDLQLAVQVSEQVATILEPDQLLDHVVELTKERFGLYHVQIYLADRRGGRLDLAAGSGEAGRLMKEGGHRIPSHMERSLVVRAARSKRPVVVDNVIQDPDFLPNPMLPHTRSEAAVPLVVANRVLGVLDVQSEQVSRFDADMLAVLSTLAGQIAVAVQNAGLFEQTQSSQQLLRAIIDTSPDWIFTKDTNYRYILVNQAFAEFYGQRTPEEMVGKDDYDLGTPAEFIEGNPEKGIVGFRTDDRAVVEGGESIHNPHDAVNYADGTVHIFDTSKLPLRDAEGNIIGVLGVSHDVTERLRAEAEVRKRASEMQAVAEVGTEVTSLLDAEQLLWNVSNLTQERFDLYHAHIYLLDDTGTSLRLVAGAGESGQAMVSMGHGIPLNSERSVVARAARVHRAVIVNNVMQSPDFLPNPLLPKTRAEMAVPLIVGERVLGVLDVQSDRIDRFTEEDMRVMTILASQIAVAVQNAGLFEQTQRSQREIHKRAAEMQIVAEVGAEAASLLDPEQLLWDVANLTKERFDLYHAHLYLLDDAGENLVLRAGAGDAGRAMVETRLAIPVANLRSVVSRAARGHQAVIVNDVIQSPDFLPNPLLPKTRAEMAVPLIVGDWALGVLDVQSDQIDRFTEEDMRVMAILASQIAVAVQNARQFEATQSSQQLLRLLIDNLPDHIYVKDRQGRFTIRNKAGALHMGAATAEEVIGKTDFDYYPPELAEIYYADEQAIIQSGQPLIDHEEPVVDGEGNQGWLLTTKMPLRDRQGAIIGLVGIGHDITELKRAEQERAERERLLRTLIDNLPDLIYAKDTESRYILSNAAHARFLGFESPDEAFGKTVFDLYPPELAPQYYADDRTVIESGEPIEREELEVDHAGHRRWSWVTKVPLRDDRGEVVGLVGLARDITERREAELERIEREQLLRSIVDTTPAWIFVKGRDHRFMLANKMFAYEYSGLEPDEMVGKDDYDLGKPPELIEGNPEKRIVGFWPADRAVMEEGQTIHLDYDPVTFRDGSPHVLDTTKVPLRDADGNIIGVLAVSLDITERLKAEETIRRYAGEMETVAAVGTEAATSLEPDKLLQSVSDLTQERFGLYHAHIYLIDSRGEGLVLVAGSGLAGQRMVAAGHRIALGNERSLVARAARIRRPVVINDVTQVSDFLPNPLLPATRAEMAVPMIAGKRIIGVLDVQADQVDRFTAEDMRVMTILAAQVAVAVQNAQLYAEQVEVADRLRDVDRLKSEFLASMSHELRTPLNSIIGYAEVLLDGIDGELTDDMQEDITAIHGSGKHLLNLINDILDLAKIEAGQMDLVTESLDLRPLAEDMVNASRVLLKDKPVELMLDLPDDLPLLRADGLRLRQIINNLLTNAIKFTEEGQITLLARVHEADPRKVVIAVMDTGIGIKEEHLPMIFDRFRQVDQSHTRRASGTGLGLSITRQLVQLHGGEIWAESESGAGSTFYFTIPGELEESVTA